jgi:hypothetical protein
VRSLSVETFSIKPSWGRRPDDDDAAAASRRLSLVNTFAAFSNRKSLSLGFGGGEGQMCLNWSTDIYKMCGREFPPFFHFIVNFPGSLLDAANMQIKRQQEDTNNGPSQSQLQGGGQGSSAQLKLRNWGVMGSIKSTHCYGRSFNSL